MSTFSVCPYNAFAVTTDGMLWGWGKNTSNVFQAEEKEVLSPVTVFNSTKSVSTGSSFVLAVRMDDTLWGWGLNKNGQLGLGTNTEKENTPVKIMDDVSSVFASSGFSVVLKKDDSLWVSGNNVYGVLGNGTYTYQEPYDAGNGRTLYRQVDNNSNKFVKVMDNVKSFHASFGNIVAIDRNNCLWAWGKNRIEVGDVISGVTDTYGLITGDDELFSVNAPYKLMDGVRSACVAGNRLCILKLNGELIEWKSPVRQRTLLYNVKYIDASDMTVAAITNDDSLICWGLKNTGQNNKDYHKIAKDVVYAAVSDKFVGYIDKQNNVYCAGINYNGIVGNGEKSVPPLVAPGAMPPVIESDYVYPPVKVLSNVAYKEISSAQVSYDMQINEVTVYFDVPPMSRQGETFIPIRAFLEAHDMDVTWNSTEMTATAINGDIKIVFRYNSDVAYLNGNSVKLKYAVTIVNGRTMIMAEDLASILKMNVTVSADEKTIFLGT